jgi:DNA-binding XRE family transcriptional regulator
MIDRNEVMPGAGLRRPRCERENLDRPGTPPCLGQIVPNDKANASRDRKRPTVDNWIMGKIQSKSAYKNDFIARVAWARKARGYTQQQLADLLDIDQGTYKQYETRSFLAHDLVPRFCLLCGVDPSWLFTGIGRVPMAAPAPNRAGKARRKGEKAA